jgi:predicted nucleotidyltransferase component of viral defense system
MIEKRLVQWYAADGGVDLDIAEREIVLAYVLRILSDHGLLDHLAFKGGTAIRKLFLGSIGRFSLDLDFTVAGDVAPDALLLDLVSTLHEKTHYGLTFSIPDADYYATTDSCGAEATYRHDWVTGGRFGIRISCRAQPLLPVKPLPLRRERYTEWLGVEPPDVPALDLHEVIAEKIRAAAQRSRVRDLFDLHQLAGQRFDRPIVRRITVLKCWETGYALDPKVFLDGLSEAKYNWFDLRRLVRRDLVIAPDEVVQGVQQGYAFLSQLSADEAQLAADSYGRERRTYERLVDSLREGK